jgi:aminoglycoside phosphotransferase
MVDVLLAAARAIGRDLTPVATLRGGGRTRVMRAAVDGGADTVIVKAHAPEFADHWARESAALTVLRGRGLPVPEVLAVVDDPALIVETDLGGGPSLADALLGADADAATRRLSAWADTLARLHAATVGDGPAFTAALDTRLSTVELMPTLLAAAADQLAAGLPAIGVIPDPTALERLRGAEGMLGPDAHVLTPADACPDNNVATPTGLALVDFEQATVRHVAWDAAYLLVPWPSCWCSWDLPADVAAAALARWRAAVAPAIPAVGTGAFDRNLDVAVTAWAMLSSAWFLPGALDEENEIGDGDRRGPTRRAVIQHRMRLAAARRDVSPALAELADDILAATTPRWGDLRLPVAPAYRARAA